MGTQTPTATPARTSRGMRRIVFALLALLLVCSSALADAVRPVTLRVKE